MTDFDEYLDLPEDPEMAFVEYEHRRRQELWSAIEDLSHDNWVYIEDRKMYYISKVMAFHDAHEFTFLESPNIRRRDDSFNELFDVFLDRVTHATTLIEVRHARRIKPIRTLLTLNPDIKQKIHSYIAKIREIIEPIDLRANKKEALYSKLNAFAEEVDQDRTKAEALMAFVLEVASTGGKAAKELEPVKQLSDSIANLLGKAKGFSEQLRLPTSRETKRIEPPKQKLPKPEQDPSPKSSDLDDEIPF